MSDSESEEERNPELDEPPPSSPPPPQVSFSCFLRLSYLGRPMKIIFK